MSKLTTAHRLSAALVAAVSLFFSACSLFGCSAQTAAQYGWLGETAMAAGCNLLDLVPAEGPVLASVCAGFEPDVTNAVNAAKAQVAAQNAAPVPSTVPSIATRPSPGSPIENPPGDAGTATPGPFPTASSSASLPVPLVPSSLAVSAPKLAAPAKPEARQALYKTVNGKRVLVGYCACSLAKAAQAYLDKSAPSGAGGSAAK